VSRDEDGIVILGWTGLRGGDDEVLLFWRMEEIGYDPGEMVVTNQATYVL
jgi:hypothetical protein